jgi:hypothetical protein
METDSHVLNREDSYIGIVRCRHEKTEADCPQCQMLAFLCVNSYSKELPFILKDLSKLIFKELKMIYFREWQAQISFFEANRWHFIVREPAIHKTIFLSKKHYQDNALAVKLEKEKRLQGVTKKAEKLRRQAQKQQQRHRK